MRYFVLLATACLAAGCTTNEGTEPVDMAANDEAKLSAQLAGYAPDGPPVSCVSLRDLGGNRSAGEAAIVFDGRSGRKWVNRPAGGCPSLGLGRALKTRTTGSQLCRGDIATVFDPVAHIDYGGCGLGDFEPYRRVRG